MVPHAGAWDNAGVGQLYGGAHPVHGSGGQGVHRDDAARSDLFRYRLYQFAALHAGGAQHSGGQGRYRPEGTEVLRYLLHQMAGDHGVVGHPGPDGVGRNGPVAQPYHQACGLLGQLEQPIQLGGDGPGGPAEGVLLPAGQGVQLYRHIGAHRLAQRAGALLVQDIHRSDLIPLPQTVPGPDALQLGLLLRRLGPQLLGLQRQIRPSFQHCFLPPHINILCRIHTPSAIFSGNGCDIQKNVKKPKKSVAFFPPGC